MKRKYLTLFITGLDRASRRIVIPEPLVKYFYHYLTGTLIFFLSVFGIGFVIFSNYNNVKSENSALIGKIESLQKETDEIVSNKLKEKLSSIDVSLSKIDNYLQERGVKGDTKNTGLIPYGNYNVAVINKYYSVSKELYEKLRSVPLGYPYRGEMSSEYGYRTNPFGGSGGEFHSGIDFRGDIGDEIKASADGFVKTADWYGGYGNAVVIDHKYGLSTVYGHLFRVNVTSGQFVKAGDVIGYLGSTGRSTGPHLHYEIRKNGSDIDPSEFFSIK